MTPGDVKARVTKIAERVFDSEAAHALEDKLHRDVLKAMASGKLGADEMTALAQEALKTLKLDFKRWTA